jgi:hypothetical protein
MESSYPPAPSSSSLTPKPDTSQSSTPSGQENDSASNQKLSQTPTLHDAEKDSAPGHQDDGSSLSQRLSRDLSRQLSRIATSDYAAGMRLAMIVVALVLSIFLVALDMTIVATGELYPHQAA